MILPALCRSEIFRSLPFLLPVVTVNAGLWVALFFGAAAGRMKTVPASWLVLAGWLSVALVLVVGPVRNRCHLVDLALPVSARRLRWSHLTSVAVASCVVVAAYVLAVALLGGLCSERAALGASPFRLALLLVAGALLATVSLDSFRPKLARIPVTASYVLWVAVVLTGTATVLVALSRAHSGFALALVAVSAGVAWRLLRATPGAFVIVPTDLAGREPETAPAAGADRATRRRPGRILVRTLPRLLSLGPKDFVTYPFLAALGIALGGGLAAIADDADANVLRLWQVPVATYFLASTWAVRLGSLHLVDPLPVRRRTIFALLTLPPLAVFGLGYGVGAVLAARANARSEPVGFVETLKGPRFDVPPRFYRIARDGNPPEIGSPWGETFIPKARYRVLPGSRAALYNPFSFGPDSSLEFTALQISRAVEAVYGMSIPPEEVAARYLARGPDGGVAPREGGMALREDYPGIAPRPPSPALVLLLPAVAVPWLLVAALLLRAYRPCVPERVRVSIVLGSGVFLIVTMAGLVAAMIGGVFVPPVADMLLDSAARRIAASWLSTAVAWLVCGAAVLGVYRLAEASFFRMEIPARPTTYTLVEWMRERG